MSSVFGSWREGKGDRQTDRYITVITSLMKMVKIVRPFSSASFIDIDFDSSRGLKKNKITAYNHTHR